MINISEHMKKLLVSLFALLPMFLFAGVIVKQSGENIEDVSVKSITDTEVLYVLQDGSEASIQKSEVSAVLYDDGRYEEIKHDVNVMPTEQASSDSALPEGTNDAVLDADAKEYNVYAFGVYGMIGYFAKEEYDGAEVEYRVIYKSSGATEFKLLGTAPFAYVTQKAYDSPIMHTNAAFASLMSVNPLVIPNAKDVKKIEFRLSKHGYNTVVVAPIKDALLVGGALLMIPMNKLKPLK